MVVSLLPFRPHRPPKIEPWHDPMASFLVCTDDSYESSLSPGTELSRLHCPLVFILDAPAFKLFFLFRYLTALHSQFEQTDSGVRHPGKTPLLRPFQLFITSNPSRLMTLAFQFRGQPSSPLPAFFLISVDSQIMSAAPFPAVPTLFFPRPAPPLAAYQMAIDRRRLEEFCDVSALSCLQLSFSKTPEPIANAKPNQCSVVLLPTASRPNSFPRSISRSTLGSLVGRVPPFIPLPGFLVQVLDSSHSNREQKTRPFPFLVLCPRTLLFFSGFLGNLFFPEFKAC